MRHLKASSIDLPMFEREANQVDGDIRVNGLHAIQTTMTFFFLPSIADDPAHQRPVEYRAGIARCGLAGCHRHPMTRTSRARHEGAADMARSTDPENIHASSSKEARVRAGFVACSG